MTRLKYLLNFTKTFGNDCQGFHCFAIKLNILICRVQRRLNWMIYVAFTVLFWLIVGDVFLAVRTKIHPNQELIKIFNGIIFAILAVLVTVLIYLIHVISGLIDNYEIAVQRNFQRARIMFTRSKYFKYKLLVKRAKSIQAVEVRCGFYGKVDRAFARSYLHDIVLRCFDITLIDINF